MDDGEGRHDAAPRRCARRRWNGARYLGLDADIGSLEPGKLADLVVIDGDVLRDIRVSDRVTHVMLNGRLYDALDA